MTRLRKIKAILLDWDDSVTATHEKIFDLYGKFAQSQKLPKPAVQSLKSLWGKPLRGILEGLFPDESGEELERQFISFVPKNHVVEPFPWSEVTLEKLSKKYLLGVVSSTPKRGFDITLKKFLRLSEINFVYCQTGDDCPYHKPDPRVFDSALERLQVLGVLPNETMYVGDALVDFEASRQKDLLFAAVLTGFTSKSDFLKAGLAKDMILDNLAQLPNRLIGR